MVHQARCAVWRRPCLSRDGTVAVEGARSLSHKVEDMVMYDSGTINIVIGSVFWALLLIGGTLTIGALTDSLNTYIVI